MKFGRGGPSCPFLVRAQFNFVLFGPSLAIGAPGRQRVGDHDIASILQITSQR